MECKITTVPPVPIEPTYNLNLNLNREELVRLGKVFGAIGGTGPTRLLIMNLYNSILKILGEGFYKNFYGNVESEMYLSGD